MNKNAKSTKSHSTRKSSGSSPNESMKSPIGENRNESGHSRSQTAQMSTSQDSRTKSTGNSKQGSHSGGRREP